MNVEIGTEAALCPEKEYINGIFLAVQTKIFRKNLVFGCTINCCENIISEYLFVLVQLKT
jgi:hypothetical protein